MEENKRIHVQHYYSETPNATPIPEDVQYGEIAVNNADEKMFIKNTTGNIASFSSDEKLIEQIESSLSDYATVDYVDSTFSKVVNDDSLLKVVDEKNNVNKTSLKIGNVEIQSGEVSYALYIEQLNMNDATYNGIVAEFTGEYREYGWKDGDDADPSNNKGVAMVFRPTEYTYDDDSFVDELFVQIHGWDDANTTNNISVYAVWAIWDETYETEIQWMEGEQIVRSFTQVADSDLSSRLLVNNVPVAVVTDLPDVKKVISKVSNDVINTDKMVMGNSSILDNDFEGDNEFITGNVIEVGSHKLSLESREEIDLGCYRHNTSIIKAGEIGAYYGPRFVDGTDSSSISFGEYGLSVTSGEEFVSNTLTVNNNVISIESKNNESESGSTITLDPDGAYYNGKKIATVGDIPTMVDAYTKKESDEKYQTKLTIDTELNSQSDNPIANKAVADAIKGGVHFRGVYDRLPDEMTTMRDEDGMEIYNDTKQIGRWFRYEEGGEGLEEIIDKEVILYEGDIIIISPNVQGSDSVGEDVPEEPTKEYILTYAGSGADEWHWVELGDVTPAQGIINESLKDYYNKEQIEENFQPKGEYATEKWVKEQGYITSNDIPEVTDVYTKSEADSTFLKKSDKYDDTEVRGLITTAQNAAEKVATDFNTAMSQIKILNSKIAKLEEYITALSNLVESYHGETPGCTDPTDGDDYPCVACDCTVDENDEVCTELEGHIDCNCAEDEGDCQIPGEGGDSNPSGCESPGFDDSCYMLGEVDNMPQCECIEDGDEEPECECSEDGDNDCSDDGEGHTCECPEEDAGESY